MKLISVCRRGVPAAALCLAFYGIPLLAAERPATELGVRYWLSEGRTAWNHTAGGGFGNPTSVLTYDRLTAHSVELHAHRGLGEAWFVRGDAGVGHIRSGRLDDDDYFAGQVLFSSTRSDVRGDGLSHFTLDVGRTLGGAWQARGARLHLFAGYQYWSERYEAYGLRYRVNLFGDPDLGGNVPVIRNEVRWSSLRAGIGGRFELGRTALLADFALVPYTELHNRDFHYLRGDLGPVPNIHMNGHGSGWQFQAEARRALGRNVELGLGVRHWHLKADGTIRFQPAPGGLPLNRLETRHTGLTATLAWRH
ncbi:MAG TPA: hypothetical protein VM489_09785 [Burkholderiales bacterium]|nr:hypothetical protein [Burkholderiales bacterium]